MKKLLFMLCLAIILTGCGNDTSDSKEAKGEKAESEEKETNAYKEKIVDYYEFKDPARELSEVEKEMLRKPGKFSEDHYDQSKVHAALDELPKDLTAQQYLDEMIYLLAEDYHEGIETYVNFSTSVDINIARPDGNIDTPSIKKTHFALLMDSSGSMNGEISGKTKMATAKEAVKDFAEIVPESSTVSLRIYGHKGTGSDKDKKLSCSQTETVFNGTYNEPKFDQSLNKFRPAGWTPIALALNSVEKDISKDAEEVVVYVVSDGIETCDGDPVAAAKKLGENENVQTVVNIIGFDVDNEGQTLLKEVADAGNGEFKYVDSERELKEYMREQYEELQKEWHDWKEEGKEQAWDLKEEKKALAWDTKEALKEKSEREKERLKEAQEYLEKKYDDNDHPINDTFSLIINRHNEIWRYAIDTGNNLWTEAVENGNNEWGKYVDEGNKKINETIDKKNDY